MDEMCLQSHNVTFIGWICVCEFFEDGDFLETSFVAECQE